MYTVYSSNMRAVTVDKLNETVQLLTLELVQLKPTLIVYPPLTVHFNPALLDEHIASTVTVLEPVNN